MLRKRCTKAAVQRKALWTLVNITSRGGYNG
ncbi:hypothetical protein G3219_11400 [Vibrio parahaemolyticus]|nr:hypothetical protein [Vibrio parahaemolyticus]